MKKYLITFLVFASLLLVGCGDAEVKQIEKPIAVSVQKAKIGEIENTNNFTGTTKVKEQTAVTVEMAGIIEEIYVSLGQEVKKGDKLLTIKGDDVENSIKQAQAALELAKANYANSTDGTVESQQNQLDNSLKLAQMQYDEAKRNYDIYTQLYDQGAVSEDQYKKIELSLNQAEQQLELAQKTYETSTEKSIPQLKELAEKQLNQAEIAYEVASSNLNKLILTAPIDGIITAKNFNANEMISQQQPAFIISDSNIIEIDLSVTQSDIDKFKTGEEVEVIIDGQSITGKVEYVPIIHNEKGSLYTVKVIIDNTETNFRAGMSAEVKLSIEKQEDTINIPKKSVFEEDGQQYVYIANSDNIAVKTAVETGIETEKTIEIKSGLNQEDIVVIGGITLISDGTKIFPVEKES